MFENIAAIDIGSASIKMVLAKKGLRDFKITDQVIEPIEHSDDASDESVHEAITRLLEKNPIKGYNVLTNIPMEKAIIRNLTFPFTDREKIAEAIPFEAQENIPFSIEDLDLDFQTLHSPLDTEGRVLVAATHCDTVVQQLAFLDECGIKPIFMGLESNALFECYSYFAYSGDENVIQVDIGHNKTVINIIRDNKLLFTRCITIGTGLLVKVIADAQGISEDDAQKALIGLRLDVNDFDANIQKNHFKNYGITKSKLKTIHTKSTALVADLVEQINITIKSFSVDHGSLQFNRLLYSGGGSNIIGLGQLLQKGTGITAAQSEFPVAFGMILTYFTKRKNSINFLKGDYLPDYVSESRRQYMLAGTFAGLAILIFLLNFGISTAFQTMSNSRYDAALGQQFKHYFPNHPFDGDPVDEAEKIVKTEKKELDSLKTIVPADMSILEALQNVTGLFQKDPVFQLRNLVIDGEFIRFDGDTDSGTKVDDFKNKLTESNRFESVTLNTTMAKRDLVNFSIVIKKKVALKSKTDGGDK